MEGYCKYCGHAIEDISPEGIGKLLEGKMSMYYWEDYAVGSEVFVPGLGEVKIVHNTYQNIAGGDGDLKLVWETPYGPVGITGHYSSYHGSVWHDDFSKAEKKTKEVVYYE